MQRSVAHMDLDSFFVSVECLRNTSLKGKPLLVGGTGDRGVVASCSYEARQFGIHSAMPMRLAKRLCPEAIVVKGDYDQYSHYSNLVTDVIRQNVPLYEKTSIDEFYLDLSGMDRFFGCYKWASELREKIIKESGLPISFGLSVNKTISKIATGEAKPNGQMQIPYGEEKPFLAPLSIRKIPMIGLQTYRQLREMGIEKVRTLQQMPLEQMETLLGQTGIAIWKKAQGIDNTPIEPYSERKSISTEETFQKDTIDITKLKAVLIGMTEKLGFQLRSQQKLTSCITVKIRYSDFETHTQQRRIAYSSSDHSLIKVVKELFDKLYNRRLLIRLVGVKFSHLVGGGHQIHLFEDAEEMINLYQAMDKMRIRFGESAVNRAISMEHLSEPRQIHSFK